MIERLLSEALSEKFQEEGLTDCFLVDIVIKKNDKVEVYIDSDTNLPIAKCQKVSRFLEMKIEENGWLGEKYTLDVSSPGTDRPLKLKRQYVKNIGRRIRITNLEEEISEGKLIEANQETISVQVAKDKVEEIQMDTIKNAKILVSFK